MQQVAFCEIQAKSSKNVGVLGQYTRLKSLQISEFLRHFCTCYSCFSSKMIKIHPKRTFLFRWIRLQEWSSTHNLSFRAHIFNFVIFHQELSEEWHSTFIQDLCLSVLWKSRVQRTLNTLNGQANIFLIFSHVFNPCSKKKLKLNGRELIENEFKQVLCRPNHCFGRSATTCTNTGCLAGIAHPQG